MLPVVWLTSINTRWCKQTQHQTAIHPLVASLVNEVISMRIQHTLMLGISLSLAVALPALAYQQGTAGGQRPGNAAPMHQMQRGTMQQNRVMDRSQIYGSQLMTPAERNAFRKKMRSMKTNRERETLRMQHHEQMQKRAAERGVTLPDMPAHQGGAMSPRGGIQQPTPSSKDKSGG